MKKTISRDPSMDVIRCFALLCVIAVHFFLNIKFYDSEVAGPRMVLMTLMRTSLMVCVPLFILLSGYLMCRKAPNKAYYAKISKTIVIYILASLCCLAYKWACQDAELTLSGTLTGILAFTAAPYSWYIEMYLGLFMAPEVVAAARKTGVFAAELFTSLGYACLPSAEMPDGDIITVLQLGSAEALTAFCCGIQAGSPVDSYVAPEAWDMPGYDSRVIMAAGTFTGGASIELSADAPIRAPFAAYLQGGLTYPTGKYGVLTAAQKMLEAGLLSL